MLKRTDPLSVIKSSCLPLAVACMLFASSANAQWVLIDDFQGVAPGTLLEGTTGPGATWTGNLTSTATAEPDPFCPANLALRQTGAPGNSVLRAAFTNASTNIAAGATGTLFYRIRTPVAATGTTDHVIGLTDNAAITNFDFKSGLRNVVPVGVNTMDVRNGGVYEAVAPALADDTWYSVWMVSTNTALGTFELYMQSATDTNYLTQTRLSSATGITFGYRLNGTTDIINVYFRNANNAAGVAGNDIYIDDIYIDPTSSNLANPAVAVPCFPTLKGDINIDGCVDFLDIFPFITVLSSPFFLAEADCNCDGMVTFADIQPFFTALINSNCP